MVEPAPNADTAALVPELAHLLELAAAHPLTMPPSHELVPRLTALQLRVEQGGAWRRRALGAPRARARMLQTTVGWLAHVGRLGPLHVSPNQVYVVVLLAYFACMEGDGPTELLQLHGGRTLAALLTCVAWTTGTYEPHDGLAAAARACSIVACVASHAGARAALLRGADGGRAALDHMAAFCCRVLALHHDQGATRPPVPGEALAALASLRAATVALDDAPRRLAVARAAAASLRNDCFCGAAAAAVGEVARNAVLTAREAEDALPELFEPALSAAELWPRAAGAQRQLLSLLYNLSCSDVTRRVLGFRAALVVRTGRVAVRALADHGRDAGVAEAALRALLHPCSSCIGVEAAGGAWLLDEGGMDVLAGALRRLVDAREWLLAARAADVLAAWLRNPACRERLEEPLYGALCAAARACRARDVPDALRIALSAALTGFSRHVAHGLRVQEALALMEEEEAEQDVGRVDDGGAQAREAGAAAATMRLPPAA